MGRRYRSNLIALFGDPVDDNPTGVMMEAAFAALGMDYRYMTCLVKNGCLEDAVNGARAMGFCGMNFTMPHKTEAWKLMDELSPAARIIGAINTCFSRNGKLVGDNTDGKGFISALEKDGVSALGKRIMILGAGGAAKAIAVESALAGAREIVIANRTFSHAQSLAEVIEANTGCKAEACQGVPDMMIPGDIDVLVNATSIGLAPYDDEKPDLDYKSIVPSMVVCDVVFHPSDSLFLKMARSRGAQTVDGLGMLVCQGALAFELWTGQKAPVMVMEKTLSAQLC
ncbi:MAG: shikimate dehydrogenase [Sphaerochaetaceae bacterium]|jgi:shikimate dehydrogenase|nr:shikimate dehydrogenase [Sphaerochaetaceae bacterium]NLY06876.1 shikimate dehydrogenase [Spirochaetales bacterium]